jgi:two-component system OmpR family sensor kinase
MSDIDPDAFGILCRNLLENALRHGAETAAVGVTLTGDAQLIVSNDGPVLPRDTLDRLTVRFERASDSTDGSGLGLAIVVAIADRIGSQLILESPRPGAFPGFPQVANRRCGHHRARRDAQDVTNVGKSAASRLLPHHGVVAQHLANGRAIR